MIRKFLSLLFALLLSVISTSAVFAASYPSPPSQVEDAAVSGGGNLTPIGAHRQDGNDTATTGTDGDTTQLTANKFGNLKVQVEPSAKGTFSATSAAVGRASSATDMFLINGSGTKTIKVLKVYVNYSASSTAGVNAFYVVKQSTAGSGGTSSTITACPLDSNNSAATATVKDYTANRTPGTTVANVDIITMPLYVTGGSGVPVKQCLFDADKFGQPVVLRGTAEGLAISNNGASLTGTTAIAGFTVVWTEESSIGFLFLYLGRLFLLVIRRKRVTPAKVLSLFGSLDDKRMVA